MPEAVDGGTQLRRLHPDQPHRLKQVKGFTNKYDVDRLVYFEQFDDAENAIKREKRLKKYNRARKIRLIEELNPNWDDLYPSIAGV
jgi:putative endonuclease